MIVEGVTPPEAPGRPADEHLSKRAAERAARPQAPPPRPEPPRSS